MFIIFLRFSKHRSRAADLMADHNSWLARGFDSGLFLLAGSLQPNAGGAILARGAERSVIEALVAEDPFVAEDVVTAEIHEISPGRLDERLDFVKG
jgi:uncharacterized protein YciI